MHFKQEVRWPGHYMAEFELLVPARYLHVYNGILLIPNENPTNVLDIKPFKLSYKIMFHIPTNTTILLCRVELNPKQNNYPNQNNHTKDSI